MDIREYQIRAHATAIYPRMAIVDTDGLTDGYFNLAYPGLGLAGEAGEVADKIKKLIRDKHGSIDAADRAGLVKELGDVLWYVAAIATQLGVGLDEVAKTNLDKLAARAGTGTIVGSGDDR